MTEDDRGKDRLTEYERAICYYTLPKVIHPVTYGLIVAYTVCLLEALGAAIIGVLTQHQVWKTTGAIAFTALVVFGMVVFTVRALLNEIQQRRALKAGRLPQVPREETDKALLPDPFAEHTLLLMLRRPKALDYLCWDDKGKPRYQVMPEPSRNRWTVADADGTPLFEVHGERGVRSFSFGTNLPSRLRLFENGEAVAEIERAAGLWKQETCIRLLSNPEEEYAVRQRGIFRGDVLVGRIYWLRRLLYLDIRTEHLNHALLAYYLLQTG